MSLRSLLLYCVIGILFWGVRIVYDSLIGLRPLPDTDGMAPVRIVCMYALGVCLATVLWPAIAPMWILAAWTHKEEKRQ